MNKEALRGSEFRTRFGLTPADLTEWTRLKLIRPAGYSDSQEPLFSDDAAPRIAHVQKLMALGYRLEEIQKIIKKVGLPIEKQDKRDRESKDKYLTVGSLAEQSKVSPRTIKHWEDKGIIEPDMRSEGGFRLYPKVYVYLCQLIKDLQLFGYTLEEIKVISDYFRDFLALQKDLNAFPVQEAAAKLDRMLKAISSFSDKMLLFKEGIARWESLLKKKKKEIMALKQKNEKWKISKKGGRHA